MLPTLAVISSVYAAAERVPELTVTGYGKVFYTVDRADIQFSVSVRDKNVQECKTKHDAIVERLSEYLKAKEYPREILSLESTILRRERSSSRRLEDDYYLAQSTYSTRTARIGELSSLQADMVEIGVDEIQFVKLFSSKQRELEDQARKRALQDAKSKAALTADELGWTLDKPIRASYTGTPWHGRSRGFGSRGGSAAVAPVVTSANSVDITVQVTFSYDTGD